MGCSTLLACLASAMRGSSLCMLCSVARRIAGGVVLLEPPEAGTNQPRFIQTWCFATAFGTSYQPLHAPAA